MNATAKLLLPMDVVVAPVAGLAAELRREVDHEPDDFLVTRVPAGSESIVVDADTAALLEHFRSPSTVADAIVAFCHTRELEPQRTLHDAFATLTDLVAASVLVPAESSTRREWPTYRYYGVYRKQFSEEECRAIISLHESCSMVASKMNYYTGEPVRDSSIFWLSRNDQTEWIFSRLWQAVKRFNEEYQFELSPGIAMAQLTRYTPGQQYNWHMDLGPNEASVRKISIVLQLSSNKDKQGGDFEIFYGDSIENQMHVDIGDVVMFPSFVMHRATAVASGVRWSLVIWFTGPQPLR
jgi:hypothetical protein